MQRTHYVLNVAISRLHAFAESFRFPVTFEDHEISSILRIDFFDMKNPLCVSWQLLSPTSKTGKKPFARMGGKFGTILKSMLIIDITQRGGPY